MSDLSIEKLLSKAFSQGRFVDDLKGTEVAKIAEEDFIHMLDKLLAAKRIQPNQPLLEQLPKHFIHEELSFELINKVFFVDLFFEKIDKIMRVDADILSLFGRLRLLVLGFVVMQDSFLKSSKHPVRQILDDLFMWCVGWNNSLSGNGKTLYIELERFCECLSLLRPDDKTLPKDISEQRAVIQSLNQRFEKLEERLCESETGMLKSLLSRRKVDIFINDLMRGKKFPSDVAHFLQQPWHHSLLINILEFGEESREWENLKSITEKLIYTFEPTESENERQVVYQLIPKISASLSAHLDSVRDEEEKKRLLGLIEKQHMLILKGSELSVEKALLLDELQLDSASMRVSGMVSDKAYKLKKKQWLQYKTEDGKVIYGKLAFSHVAAANFIFVNRVGVKCLEKSAEKLGYALTSKKAVLLESEQPFTKILRASLEVFLRQYQQQQYKTLAVTDLTAQKTSPESTLKEEAKRKKQASVKKALAEIARLKQQSQNKKQSSVDKSATEVEQLKTQVPLSEQDQASSESIDIVEEVRSLSIGSWIAMENSAGEKIACKVLIIYSATGKMIFVNKEGFKVGEYRVSELAKMILQGKAEIIGQEQTFDNTLEEVIKTLRKD